MEKEKVIHLYDEESNLPTYMDTESFFNFAKNFHGNKAIVLYYIVNNMDKRSNVFYGTCKGISEAVHLSRPTVAKILKFMQSLGVINMKQLGVWEVDVNNVSNIISTQGA